MTKSERAQRDMFERVLRGMVDRQLAVAKDPGATPEMKENARTLASAYLTVLHMVGHPEELFKMAFAIGLI